mmetsp:Transcript_4994/g.7577  ORF Transcript_4994/g.7577 Transcript_4994/m.7577 type:complete len:90 (-) Transcript_4994:690-959(-)
MTHTLWKQYRWMQEFFSIKIFSGNSIQAIKKRTTSKKPFKSGVAQKPLLKYYSWQPWPVQAQSSFPSCNYFPSNILATLQSTLLLFITP